MTITIPGIGDVAAPARTSSFDGGGDMSTRRWSSVIWLTFVVLTACAAARARPGAPWRPTVEVVNGSCTRVQIFVVVDGEAKELGVVAADTQVRLALPGEVVGAVVQFGVASPDGTSRNYLQPIFRFRSGMEFRLRLLPEDVPVAARATTA